MERGLVHHQGRLDPGDLARFQSEEEIMDQEPMSASEIADRIAMELGEDEQVAELLAALQTPAYIVRQAVLKPKYIVNAKKAIKQAFQYQLEGRCYSFVELVSTCPTNWGLTPLEAVKWAEDVMMPYYPLGQYKTPEVSAA